MHRPGQGRIGLVPELPEVESLAIFLRERAVGRIIDWAASATFAVLKTYQPDLGVLTGREINALLANSTNELKNYIYVSVEGSQIKGQLSLPLEKYFKIWMIHTQGRYLNGAATMTVGLTNSTLWVKLDSLDVNGKPPSEKFMAALRGQNMAANANSDPKESAFINRFESIVVTNGTIILKARENVPPAAAATN